ncbi:MAG: hypothetical protein ACRDRX_04485 [Pseudonocardiaceae bacterium]
MTDLDKEGHYELPPGEAVTTWRDDVDPRWMEVAAAGVWQATLDGRSDAWEVAIDRLYPGQLVTRVKADAMAEGAVRFCQAEISGLKRQIEYLITAHRQETADMRAQLDAVRCLVDHRRKTAPMADLEAALNTRSRA